MSTSSGTCLRWHLARRRLGRGPGWWSVCLQLQPVLHGMVTTGSAATRWSGRCSCTTTSAAGCRWGDCAPFRVTCSAGPAARSCHPRRVKPTQGLAGCAAAGSLPAGMHQSGRRLRGPGLHVEQPQALLGAAPVWSVLPCVHTWGVQRGQVHAVKQAGACSGCACLELSGVHGPPNMLGLLPCTFAPLSGGPARWGAGCARVAQLLFRHGWYPAPMAWLPLLCQWKGRSKPGGPDMEDVGGASQWRGHALWLPGSPECAPPPYLVAPPSLSLLSKCCAPWDLPVPPPHTSVAPAACPLAGCNACGGGRHGPCPAAKQCPWHVRTQLTL